MTKVIPAALAFGLLAAASAPAFAACAGHVSAEAPAKPVTTADSGRTTPPPAAPIDRQG